MVDSILLNDRNILEESFTLQRIAIVLPVRDGVNNTIKLDLNVSDKTEFENFKKHIVDGKAITGGQLKIRYKVNGAPKDRTFAKSTSWWKNQCRSFIAFRITLMSAKLS